MRKCKDQTNAGHEEKGDHRPERDEVGRKGDQDIRLVCHDMSSIESNAKSADSSKAQVDKDDVG